MRLIYKVYFNENYSTYKTVAQIDGQTNERLNLRYCCELRQCVVTLNGFVFKLFSQVWLDTALQASQEKTKLTKRKMKHSAYMNEFFLSQYAQCLQRPKLSSTKHCRSQQLYRQTNRQNDRQEDQQTDRQTDSYTDSQNDKRSTDSSTDIQSMLKK